MDQVLGEIRLVAFPKVPEGWAACDGSLMRISGNEPLFSILGTIYGGDGKTTFGLPDLRGRAAMGVNKDSTPHFVLGQKVGQELISLTAANLPPHTHPMSCNGDANSATTNDPTTAFPAVGPVGPSGTPVNTRYAAATDNTMMAASAISAAGASQAINTMQPVLVMNYIIAIAGIYPDKP